MKNFYPYGLIICGLLVILCGSATANLRATVIGCVILAVGFVIEYIVTPSDKDEE
jgi:hypothetical protein